jgi:hypothetical protein
LTLFPAATYNDELLQSKNLNEIASKRKSLGIFTHRTRIDAVIPVYRAISGVGVGGDAITVITTTNDCPT